MGKLAKLIREKGGSAYDDLDDNELELMALEKSPDYADLADPVNVVKARTRKLLTDTADQSALKRNEDLSRPSPGETPAQLAARTAVKTPMTELEKRYQRKDETEAAVDQFADLLPGGGFGIGPAAKAGVRLFNRAIAPVYEGTADIAGERLRQGLPQFEVQDIGDYLRGGAEEVADQSSLPKIEAGENLRRQRAAIEKAKTELGSPMAGVGAGGMTAGVGMPGYVPQIPDTDPRVQARATQLLQEQKTALDAESEKRRLQIGRVSSAILAREDLTEQEKYAEIEKQMQTQQAAMEGKGVADALAAGRRIAAQTFKQNGLKDEPAAIEAGRLATIAHLNNLRQQAKSRELQGIADQESATYEGFIRRYTDPVEFSRMALQDGLPLALAYATGGMTAPLLMRGGMTAAKAASWSPYLRGLIQVYGSTAVNLGVQQIYDGKIDVNDAIVNAATEVLDIPAVDAMSMAAKGASRGVAGAVKGYAANALMQGANEAVQENIGSFIQRHELLTPSETGTIFAEGAGIGTVMSPSISGMEKMRAADETRRWEAQQQRDAAKSSARVYEEYAGLNGLRTLPPNVEEQVQYAARVKSQEAGIVDPDEIREEASRIRALVIEQIDELEESERRTVLDVLHREAGKLDVEENKPEATRGDKQPLIGVNEAGKIQIGKLQMPGASGAATTLSHAAGLTIGAYFGHPLLLGIPLGGVIRQVVLPYAKRLETAAKSNLPQKTTKPVASVGTVDPAVEALGLGATGTTSLDRALAALPQPVIQQEPPVANTGGMSTPTLSIPAPPPQTTLQPQPTSTSLDTPAPQTQVAPQQPVASVRGTSTSLPSFSMPVPNLPQRPAAPVQTEPEVDPEAAEIEASIRRQFPGSPEPVVQGILKAALAERAKRKATPASTTTTATPAEPTKSKREALKEHEGNRPFHTDATMPEDPDHPYYKARDKWQSEGDAIVKGMTDEELVSSLGMENRERWDAGENLQEKHGNHAPDFAAQELIRRGKAKKRQSRTKAYPDGITDDMVVAHPVFKQVMDQFGLPDDNPNVLRSSSGQVVTKPEQARAIARSMAAAAIKEEQNEATRQKIAGESVDEQVKTLAPVVDKLIDDLKGNVGAIKAKLSKSGASQEAIDRAIAEAFGRRTVEGRYQAAQGQPVDVLGMMKEAAAKNLGVAPTEPEKTPEPAKEPEEKSVVKDVKDILEKADKATWYNSKKDIAVVLSKVNGKFVVRSYSKGKGAQYDGGMARFDTLDALAQHLADNKFGEEVLYNKGFKRLTATQIKNGKFPEKMANWLRNNGQEPQEGPSEAAGASPAPVAESGATEQGKTAPRGARTAEQRAEIKRLLEAGEYEKAANLARETSDTPADRVSDKGHKIGWRDEGDGSMVVSIDEDGIEGRIAPGKRSGQVRTGTGEQYAVGEGSREGAREFTTGAGSALVRRFASDIYKDNPGATWIKEVVQNILDAFDMQRNATGDETWLGSGEIRMDTTNGVSLTAEDDGIGMSPEFLELQMLNPGRSGKRDGEYRGNFGLAKLAILGISKDFTITSVYKRPTMAEARAKLVKAEAKQSAATSVAEKEEAANAVEVAKAEIEGVKRDGAGTVVRTVVEGRARRWLGFEGGADAHKATIFNPEVMPSGTKTGTKFEVNVDNALVKEFGHDSMPPHFLTDYIRQTMSSNMLKDDIKLYVDGKEIDVEKGKRWRLDRFPSDGTGQFVTSTDEKNKDVIDTPHATYEIYYGDETTQDNSQQKAYVELYNRGQLQSARWDNDMAVEVDSAVAGVPGVIRVNVIAKIQSTDNRYPWTFDRKNLRDNGKEVIKKFLEDKITEANKKTKSKYQEAEKSAPAVDTVKSQDIPVKLMMPQHGDAGQAAVDLAEKIAASKSAKVIAAALVKIGRKYMSAMGHKPSQIIWHLGFTEEWFGVHAPKSWYSDGKSRVLLNPWISMLRIMDKLPNITKMMDKVPDSKLGSGTTGLSRFAERNIGFIIPATYAINSIIADNENESDLGAAALLEHGRDLAEQAGYDADFYVEMLDWMRHVISTNERIGLSAATIARDALSEGETVLRKEDQKRNRPFGEPRREAFRVMHAAIAQVWIEGKKESQGNLPDRLRRLAIVISENPKMFAAELAGTIMHEIVHEREDKHDVRFASAMTAGMSAGLVVGQGVYGDLAKAFSDINLVTEVLRHATELQRLPISEEGRKALAGAVHEGEARGVAEGIQDGTREGRRGSERRADRPGKTDREASRVEQYDVKPDELGFYSQVEKVLDDAKTPKKQNGKSWLAYLTNPQRGVTKDEMYWTGLGDFLQENADRTLTTDEISAYMKANKVQIVELGSKGYEMPGFEFTEFQTSDSPSINIQTVGMVEPNLEQAPHLAGRSLGIPIKKAGAGFGARKGRFYFDGGPAGGFGSDYFETVQEAIAAAEKVLTSQIQRIHQVTKPSTRHSGYTEQGEKSNYREIRITIPRTREGENTYVKDTHYHEKGVVVTFRVNDRVPDESDYTPNDDDILRWKQEGWLTAKEDTPAFESQVKALGRMEGRRRAGKKMLFIEELQSDAGSAAKDGVRSGDVEPIMERLKEARRVAEDAQMAVGEFRSKLRFKYGDGWEDILLDRVPILGGSVYTQEEIDADADRYDELRLAETRADGIAEDIGDEVNEWNSRPPNAPFISDTKKYTDLAVKRILALAAAEGYDSVGWTSGDIQSRRWDLTKAVDRVRYDAASNTLEAFKNGDLVTAETVRPDGVAEYVGASLAEKLTAPQDKPNEWSIVQEGEYGFWSIKNSRTGEYARVPGAYTGEPGSESGKKLSYESKEKAQREADTRNSRQGRWVEVSGSDLSVGSDRWAYGYYDKFIPSAFERVGKKFGVKVTKSNLTFIQGYSPEKIGDYWYATNEEGAKGSNESGQRSFRAKEEAQKASDYLNAELESDSNRKPGRTSIQSVMISPEMRESIRGTGFPQYQVSGKPRAGERTGKKITASDIKKALPPALRSGLYVDEETGDFYVSTPGGVIRVATEDKIIIDFEQMGEGYSEEDVASAKRGEATAKGVTSVTMDGDAIVKIVETGVLGHEFTHVWLNHFATRRERKVLDRKFESVAKKHKLKTTDEVIAKAYEEYERRMEANPGWQPTSAIGQFIKKIYDFVHGMYRAINPDADSIFKGIREGKGWDRKMNQNPDSVAATYAKRMKGEAAAEAGRTEQYAKRKAKDERPYKVNRTEPVLVAGGSAFKTQIPNSNAGDPAFTIKASYKEGPMRVLYPDGTVKEVPMRGYARLMDLPDSYTLPKERNLARTVLGNGIPSSMMTALLKPLLEGIKNPKGLTSFSGGEIGFQRLKGLVKIIMGIEYDPDIVAFSRTVNDHPIMQSDIRKVDFKKWKGIDYFHASPVCKNYSDSKAQKGEVAMDLETAEAVARGIREMGPKVVTVENVPDYMDSEAMKIITDQLDALGYTWDKRSYNAADFGVPQKRNRMLLRAVKNGPLPAPPKPVAQQKGWWDTVKDLMDEVNETTELAPWQRERLAARNVITNIDEDSDRPAPGRLFSVGPRGPGSPLGRQLREAEGMRKGTGPVKGALSEKADLKPRLKQANPMAKADKSGEAVVTDDVMATPGAIAPVQYSVDTAEATNDAATEYNKKNKVFSEEQIAKFTKDIMTVAAIIHADIDRLGYKALKGAKVLKDNSDPQYLLSEDYTTLCVRRMRVADTLDAIQSRLQRMMTPEQWIEVVNELEKQGHEVSCGPCYVESRRRNMKTAIDKAINGWERSGEGFLKLEPEMVEKARTQEGRDWMFENRPDQYLIISKAFSGLQTKIPLGRAEYTSEILGLAQSGEKSVDSFNRFSGLRSQSWSDFEIPHLLDKMQATLDKALRGLMAHSYTKESNYVRLMKDTGEFINMSLVPTATGFDKDGNPAWNLTQSIRDLEEMKALREEYDNIGFEGIGVSDEHIRALLDDEMIDYIIGFHASGPNKKHLTKLGMSEWHDYGKGTKNMWGERTAEQEWVDTKTGQPVHDPNRKVFINEWKGDYKKLWALCKERGVRPPFYQFRDHKNYYKLLTDRRAFDKDGNYIEQKPVKFEFDMDLIGKMLADYRGGHKFGNPVEGVVDKFVEKFAKTPDTQKQAKPIKKKKDMLSQMKEAATGKVDLLSDAAAFTAAVKALEYGKSLPEDLYVHKLGLKGGLSKLVKALAKEHNLGKEFNIIKFSRKEHKLSFLSYPDFFDSAHPELMRAVSLDLSTGRVMDADYSQRENKPILHRKEQFLPENHPMVEEFKALSDAEAAAGLLGGKEGGSGFIGYQKQWDELLKSKGLMVDGHTLTERKSGELHSMLPSEIRQRRQEIAAKIRKEMVEKGWMDEKGNLTPEGEKAIKKEHSLKKLKPLGFVGIAVPSGQKMVKAYESGVDGIVITKTKSKLGLTHTQTGLSFGIYVPNTEGFQGSLKEWAKRIADLIGEDGLDSSDMNGLGLSKEKLAELGDLVREFKRLVKVAPRPPRKPRKPTGVLAQLLEKMREHEGEIEAMKPMTGEQVRQMAKEDPVGAVLYNATNYLMDNMHRTAHQTEIGRTYGPDTPIGEVYVGGFINKKHPAEEWLGMRKPLWVALPGDGQIYVSRTVTLLDVAEKVAREIVVGGITAKPNAQQLALIMDTTLRLLDLASKGDESAINRLRDQYKQSMKHTLAHEVLHGFRGTDDDVKRFPGMQKKMNLSAAEMLSAKTKEGTTLSEELDQYFDARSLDKAWDEDIRSLAKDAATIYEQGPRIIKATGRTIKQERNWDDVDFQKAARKTAMDRKGKPSAPSQQIVKSGLLEGKSIIDWGGGLGEDERFYKRLGNDTFMYDFNFQPELPTKNADVVINTFVANTLEPEDRHSMWKDAYERADEMLIVSVRSDKFTGIPRQDGVITGKGTFQKSFTQEGLIEELSKLFGAVNVTGFPPKGKKGISRPSGAAMAIVYKPKAGSILRK